MSGNERLGLYANIANFVRQEVRVPKSKPLLAVFEAISNSLDGIADGTGQGTIRIIVLREASELDGKTGVPHTFIVQDDGIGFTRENIDAFDQLYSDRKAGQGGKGRGRFAFLKVFGHVLVESIFEEDGQTSSRKFRFDLIYTGQKTAPKPAEGKTETRVTLSGMRPEIRRICSSRHDGPRTRVHPSLLARAAFRSEGGDHCS